MKKLLKVILVLLLTSVGYMLYQKGILNYLNLDYIQQNQLWFKNYYQNNEYKTYSLFLLIYILVTALSLPGAALMTLLAGALFGLVPGTIIVSFASSIGATIAFVVARFLLKDVVEQKFGAKLKTINQGIRSDGAFYLFSLRLIPVLPFFVINLVMGLTAMKVWTFYWVSQVGMLAGTIVYINAGVELSRISELADIVSFRLMLSFALIAIFPWGARAINGFIRRKAIYKGFKKPKHFDYNMVVIGAGAGGLVTSYISATVKAKVALIEKHSMGGDCLNTGCVPSKALIQSAKVAHMARTASRYGLHSSELTFSFKEIMSRVRDVIKKIEPHDSIERYSKLGVECIRGKAYILSPWEVKVGERVLRTKFITIATGAKPRVPAIKNLEKIPYYTSDTLWNLSELPKKLLVVGGGPIGCEMTQAFCRLGSKVSLVEFADHLMGREDLEVSEFVEKKFQAEGVKLYTGHSLEEFMVEGDRFLAACKKKTGESIRIEFDAVLLCLGRVPNTKGFGLEELGVKLRDNATIAANEYLQTNFANIFTCGDVTGPYQFTHTAGHQAWFCAVNSLFGNLKKFKVDYRVVPWCTFIDPEVATVGLNEISAKAQGIEYELTCYGIDDLDRAITDSKDEGFIRVLTVPGKDKILGATVVGQNAGDILLEFTSAMKHGFGLNAILGTIHPYPTMGEANKYAAGNWKKVQTSEKVFYYLEKFHRWQRR